MCVCVWGGILVEGEKRFKNLELCVCVSVRVHISLTSPFS